MGVSSKAEGPRPQKLGNRKFGVEIEEWWGRLGKQTGGFIDRWLNWQDGTITSNTPLQNWPCNVAPEEQFWIGCVFWLAASVARHGWQLRFRLTCLCVFIHQAAGIWLARGETLCTDVTSLPSISFVAWKLYAILKIWLEKKIQWTLVHMRCIRTNTIISRPFVVERNNKIHNKNKSMD